MRGERTHHRKLSNIRPIGKYKRPCDSGFKDMFVGDHRSGKVFFHVMYEARVYINEGEFYELWKNISDKSFL
jgi:hypothetical protein